MTTLTVIDQGCLTDPICRTDPQCSKAPACCIHEGCPPFTDAEIRNLDEPLRSEMERVRPLHEELLGRPCTKLQDDGSCGIYDVRPANCRGLGPMSEHCHWLRHLAEYE